MASRLEFFLNETSLRGQYRDVAEFESAVVDFLGLVSRVRQCTVLTRVYKSRDFEAFNAVAGVAFRASINGLRNSDTKEKFIRIVFDRLNPVTWQDEQRHSATDTFEIGTISFTGTSVAEVAERKHGNADQAFALLNFRNCPTYRDVVSVTVKKNAQTDLIVDSHCEGASLATWLQGQNCIRPTYDKSLPRPPIDDETCLSDTLRFRPTGEDRQGRSVYVELTSGKRYYVDNLHRGDAAQIEVFSKRGVHLGVAGLDGVLRPGTAVNGRRFD